MDAAAIPDPETYVRAVPHDLLDALRREAAVVRVDDFWAVLRDPRLFSSNLGGTQIRDPATPADLRYVRRMMLNTDPPDHSRLRGLPTRAFTPKAVARLTDRITVWADDLVAAVQPDGGADLAKQPADLPLLTLAEVFGVPEQDRRHGPWGWSTSPAGPSHRRRRTAVA